MTKSRLTKKNSIKLDNKLSEKVSIEKNSRSTLAAVEIKSLLIRILKNLNSIVIKLKAITTNSITWFKDRPKKVKEWMHEDRKKKKYRSFHLQKRIHPEPRDIPNFRKLLKSTVSFFWINRLLFVKIMTIHLIIMLLALRSPLDINVAKIRDSVDNAIGASGKSSTMGVVAAFGAVLGTSGQINQQMYVQVIYTGLIMGLVYIWTIRQLHNNKKILARDAYYNSLSSVIPTILIVLFLAAQMLPFVIATYIYSTARINGLFMTGFEDLSFFIIALLVGIVSFYWATSTLMAIYTVTLPGIYPLRALRVAKKIVQFQRRQVFSRIISLPLFGAFLYSFLLLVCIRFFPNATTWFVDLWVIIILPFVHIYFYKLYRALI